MEDQVGPTLNRRARHAEAQLLSARRFPAQTPEQQLDHLHVLRLGRVEQATLHGPARVTIEEFREFVGSVAVDVDMRPLDLVQDALARQHLLRHLAVGDAHEGIELRVEVDVFPVERGEYNANSFQYRAL